MRMTNDEYLDLLDEARRSASRVQGFAGVLPIDRAGKALESITPGCILYIACGEDGLIGVNDELAPFKLDVNF